MLVFQVRLKLERSWQMKNRDQLRWRSQCDGWVRFIGDWRNTHLSHYGWKFSPPNDAVVQGETSNQNPECDATLTPQGNRIKGESNKDISTTIYKCQSYMNQGVCSNFLVDSRGCRHPLESITTLSPFSWPGLVAHRRWQSPASLRR